MQVPVELNEHPLLRPGQIRPEASARRADLLL
jgi:hypothetical protein